jgi:uncharacterized protein (DUF433 family)
MMTTTTSWIEKTPDVCGGEACIRNTRHTVSGLVAWKRLGLTDERILTHHPDLTRADLEAAWDYYDHHRDEIDQALREDDEA